MGRHVPVNSRHRHAATTRPSHQTTAHRHPLDAHREVYEQIGVDGVVQPGGIPESFIQTHMLDPLAAIRNLINGPATVTIDSTGITIEDGALTLKDEFGETVLVASGFAGTWADYLRGGLYNYTFAAGIDGTVPDGRTASLPYWTVSRTGSAVVSWSDAESAKAVLSTGESATFQSDAVRVRPMGSYEVNVNGEVVGVGTAQTGTADIEVAILEYLVDGTLNTTTVLSTVRHTGTVGSPSDAYHDRFVHRVGSSTFFVAVRVKATFVSASATEASCTFRHIAYLEAPQAGWYGVLADMAGTNCTNDVTTVLTGAFTPNGGDPYDFVVTGATSKFTVPESGAGVYRVSGTVNFPAGTGAGTFRRFDLRKDTVVQVLWTWASISAQMSFPFSWVAPLADGAVIEFAARQNSGSTVSVTLSDVIIERVGHAQP